MSDDSPNGPHPCAGVWLGAAPFRGLSSGALRAVERAVGSAGGAGWVVPAGAWAADAVDGLGASTLRIDLAQGPGDSARPADLARALELEPDLVGLPVHDLERATDADLRAHVRLIERAAQDDVDVVLLARGTPAEAEALARLAAAHGPVLALSVEVVHEEALEILCRDESLCVTTSGVEFASAFRRGARAIDRFLGLLDPAAAVRLLDLCETDVTAALEVERRLQHFVEAHIEPIRRRLDASEGALGALLVALGGWCRELDPPSMPGTIDLDDLRGTLRAACPELTQAG